MRYLMCMVCCLFLISLGCKSQGPLEKAGKRADEVVDNVREGESPLKRKGTLEKAGEAVDEAVSDE